MKVTTPSGVQVDTNKCGWGQNLSEDDFYYVEDKLTRYHHPASCCCQTCADEDSAMIDAYERRQVAGHG